MPEGPECRHIAEQLHVHLVGKQLTEIIINSGRYYRHRPPKGLVELSSQLPLNIIRVGVKGKFIYFVLANNWYIWNTLGMSGQWLLNTHDTKVDNHCHITFTITNSKLDKPIKIYFRDVRNFGTIQCVYGEDNLQCKLSKLGPDILSKSPLTKKEWLDLLKKYSHWTLPKLLMDQSKISGIGNYLKSEALYEANLSPFQLIMDIPSDALWYLYLSMRELATKSYLHKGASFLTYVDATGNQGKFSFEFKVYRHTHDQYGNLVRHDQTNDGRTTWWVESIQG